MGDSFTIQYGYEVVEGAAAGEVLEASDRKPKLARAASPSAGMGLSKSDFQNEERVGVPMPTGCHGLLCTRGMA